MRPHFQTLVSITDPALYAAQALRDALRHAGIEVSRRDAREHASPFVVRADCHSSSRRRCRSFLATMLKVSQNLYAEMLFKGNCRDLHGRGGSRETLLEE